MLEGHRGETVWIVENLLPASYLAILGGMSKDGKSCLATALAMAVATGEPFLGKQVRHGPVLWCAYEESRSERQRVLREWDQEPEGFRITHKNLKIDTDAGMEAISREVFSTGAKLIVIDSLYPATTAETLTDGATARRVLTPLKRLCNEADVSALVIHHTNKAVGAGMTRERFADSNQILATASMDILMETKDQNDGSRNIYASPARARVSGLYVADQIYRRERIHPHRGGPHR